MIIREKVWVGDQQITIETGRIAKQAHGTALVTAGETVVLVTVCATTEPKAGQSFFPLSVDYVEKTYAAGKIPGGFFKREGRLRDAEVLTSRLIDRPCRPLFPEGFLNEVQIIATVMSHDKTNPPEMLALIGASAALHVSPLPWKGPIAGVRVGRIKGELIANPTYQQLAESECDLIIAATRDAIVMVEGEGDELSEEELIEALFFGHRAVQDTIDLIERMREAVGKPKWHFEAKKGPDGLEDRVRDVGLEATREACSIAEKHQRYDRFKAIKKHVVATLTPEFTGSEEFIKSSYEDLRYKTMREQVLRTERRVDGRDLTTVRPIAIELGVLPRTHGSTLFTRGETQAIVTTTLGTSRDEQRLDSLMGDTWKRFMLHYNFPAYSVGEVKRLGSAGRREVGHGNLAERALAKVLPSKEDFPYTLRIVSEITESNGSSSMASVCGGALAMMDAGIPIKAPVAGVAMGLIKEGDDYAVLTDILGDEDALGDMDFKVCGTEKGVTAIQMDIKIEGLSREIMEKALRQAKEARIHILGKMHQAISAPREEMSKHAPRITQIKVKPDQIRTIIGPGGKTIKAIVDQTGVSVDVEDDGTVSLASPDAAAIGRALEIIKGLTTEPEIGEIYEGTVRRVEPYGAFIEIMPGKDGLCHISDMDFTRIERVEDVVNLGDKVKVKITNIDRDGKIRLSRKEALPGAAANGAPRPERDERPRDNMRARDDKPRDRDERPRRREESRDERPAREERPVREEKPRETVREREEQPRDRDEARLAPPERTEERPRTRDREEPRERPVRNVDVQEARPIARPEPRPVRDERPAREDRPRLREDRLRLREDRPVRDERPVREEIRARDDRPAREDRPVRDERPARDDVRAREDRPARDDVRAREDRPVRDERPARDDVRAREDRPRLREDRPVRDERPARDDVRAREDRPVRDERPARDDVRAREDRPVRDERPALRDERPRARDDRPAPRDERPAPRDERPRARDDRPALRDERPMRDERPVRDERPRARDDRPAPREERPVREDSRTREERPVRDDRLVRDDRPRGREWERDDARPARRPERDEPVRERAVRDDRLVRDDGPRGRAPERPEAPPPARPRSIDEDDARRRPAEPREADVEARDDDRLRDENTERERPSRSRARVRTRERTRERERELDRDRR